MSAFDEILIEPDFYVFRYQNNTPEIQEVKKEISVGLIQFHFAVKGKSKFVFNNGAYGLDLLEEKSLLLYNPQKELPLHLEIQPNSWVISILISIKKFHTLFSSEANFIPFWSDENKDKKKSSTTTPSTTKTPLKKEEDKKEEDKNPLDDLFEEEEEEEKEEEEDKKEKKVD